MKVKIMIFHFDPFSDFPQSTKWLIDWSHFELVALLIPNGARLIIGIHRECVWHENQLP